MGTMMIPGAVTLIPVFVTLAKLNLVNTYWAMILPGAASVFGVYAGFEAARASRAMSRSVWWYNRAVPR